MGSMLLLSSKPRRDEYVVLQQISQAHRLLQKGWRDSCAGEDQGSGFRPVAGRQWKPLGTFMKGLGNLPGGCVDLPGGGGI